VLTLCREGKNSLKAHETFNNGKIALPHELRVIKGAFSSYSNLLAIKA